jgi:hypothetical protein
MGNGVQALKRGFELHFTFFFHFGDSLVESNLGDKLQISNAINSSLVISVQQMKTQGT